MHEPAAAQVDPDVRQLRLVLEEHQVAGTGVAERDLARGAEQLLRRPRHPVAGLRVRIEDETAAVEAFVRFRAAIAVLRADQVARQLRDCGADIGFGRAGFDDGTRRRYGPLWRAGACGYGSR